MSNTSVSTEKLFVEEETLDGEQFIVCHTQSKHLFFLFKTSIQAKTTRLATEAARDTAMRCHVQWHLCVQGVIEHGGIEGKTAPLSMKKHFLVWMKLSTGQQPQCGRHLGQASSYFLFYLTTPLQN